MNVRRYGPGLHRGFTLLELVVVIGIIVLLAALTVSVATGLVSKSEVRETQNMLKLLDLAVSEWEVAADRKPTVGAGAGFDVDSTVPGGEVEGVHRMHVTLKLLDRHAASKDILARIAPSLLEEVDEDGDPNTTDDQVLQVKDPWDEPLWAVFPGAVVPNDPDPDDDGTERLEMESELGVCVARRLYFVSAGPDGDFGDLTQSQDSIDYKAAGDNIYSSEVIIP